MSFITSEIHKKNHLFPNYFTFFKRNTHFFWPLVGFQWNHSNNKPNLLYFWKNHQILKGKCFNNFHIHSSKWIDKHFQSHITHI